MTSLSFEVAPGGGAHLACFALSFLRALPRLLSINFSIDSTVFASLYMQREGCATMWLTFWLLDTVMAASWPSCCMAASYAASGDERSQGEASCYIPVAALSGDKGTFGIEVRIADLIYAARSRVHRSTCASHWLMPSPRSSTTAEKDFWGRFLGVLGVTVQDSSVSLSRFIY